MGNHKKKSKRQSRSRSRSSDDHQSRKKSRKTRRRSSSSSSSESAHRHGRSSKPSRHRSRSRSHSPSRRRSQSRSREERRRHRRSRSNSRSRRSHSRRRSRSRERSRERRRRSRSGSRSRHSSRKCSPTERDKLKGKQAKDEKTSSDPAPSNMLKVKMQRALEDATGSTESTVTKKCVDEDDPEMKKELKRIEKDSFRQTAFKSSRWDLNAPKSSLLTSRPMSIDQSHDSAIFGSSTTNGSTHQTLQHPNVAAILYRPNWKLTCESLRASPKEKMDRWIDKLQMWRKKRIDEAEYT